MKKSKKHFISLLIIIIIVIFCIFVAYLWVNSVENMDGYVDTNKKTIFLVWSDNEIHKPTGIVMNHGLGDKMKAAIVLHQYCQMNNYDLVIDGKTNILNKYFVNLSPSRTPSNPDDSLPDNLHIFSEFENFDTAVRERWKTRNDFCVYFWTAVDKELLREVTYDDKKFIEHLLEPREYMKNELEKTKNSLPVDYGIQHYRFDDIVFKNDITADDALFKSWFDELKENYKTTDVLFSNSVNFKKYAKDKIGISTLECDSKDCIIKHTGIDLHINDEDTIKNTIKEFLLIKDAKYINSRTQYHWCSNFVKWPALIYGIPFKCKM